VVGFVSKNDNKLPPWERRRRGRVLSQRTITNYHHGRGEEEEGFGRGENNGFVVG
jgi:hypothetical protein